MSRAPKDYYAVLHVLPGAPTEIIRASYRTLMQRLKAHPDLGGEPAVAAEINEAYAVLKDPAKRAAYDAAHTATLTAAEIAHAMDGRSVADPRETHTGDARGPAQRSGGAECRVAKDEPLRFSSDWRDPEERAGVLVDLSLTGLRFRAAASLRNGQVVRV